MSPKGTYTFHKNERLCNKRQIGELYASKNRMFVYPLSIHWTVADGPAETFAGRGKAARLQVLIVAPKKKLHHAVDRNCMKRRMRECYRMRKQPLLQLLDDNNRHMTLSINYMHTELTESKQLGNRFDKMFEQLCKQLVQEDSEQL